MQDQIHHIFIIFSILGILLLGQCASPVKETSNQVDSAAYTFYEIDQVNSIMTWISLSPEAGLNGTIPLDHGITRFRNDSLNFIELNFRWRDMKASTNSSDGKALVDSVTHPVFQDSPDFPFTTIRLYDPLPLDTIQYKVLHSDFQNHFFLDQATHLTKARITIKNIEKEVMLPTLLNFGKSQFECRAFIPLHTLDWSSSTQPDSLSQLQDMVLELGIFIKVPLD